MNLVFFFNNIPPSSLHTASSGPSKGVGYFVSQVNLGVFVEHSSYNLVLQV